MFNPIKQSLNVTVDENVQPKSTEPEVDSSMMTSSSGALVQLYSRLEEISAQLRKVSTATSGPSIILRSQVDAKMRTRRKMFLIYRVRQNKVAP